MALLTSVVAMTSDLSPVDELVQVKIVDGQALDPEIGSSGTLADLIDIPLNDTISSYVVQPGDTVALVAKKFGVSENTVRWANDLKPADVLKRGQTLTILPITGIKHKVAKGDTISTIAKKYKVGHTTISYYIDEEFRKKISESK
jgi:LysM repeat protein